MFSITGELSFLIEKHLHIFLVSGHLSPNFSLSIQPNFIIIIVIAFVPSLQGNVGCVQFIIIFFNLKCSIYLLISSSIGFNEDFFEITLLTPNSPPEEDGGINALHSSTFPAKSTSIKGSLASPIISCLEKRSKS